MARGISLPDSGSFFEIRFESIGGLGAHAAGQIVASAAVLRMGLNGSHFSSYGSEKKGSVVRSFIRLAPADREIRTSAPIETPDVIVVFNGGLLAHPATLAGMRAAGTLIYAGYEREIPEGLAHLPATTKVIRVDAQTIADEERSRPNAVLIGTLTAALPFLDRKAMLDALGATFAGRHPEAVAANERAFVRGAEEFEIIENVGAWRRRSPCPVVEPALGLPDRANRWRAADYPATRLTTTCVRLVPAGCRFWIATSASTAACATWSARICAWFGRQLLATTASRASNSTASTTSTARAACVASRPVQRLR